MDIQITTEVQPRYTTLKLYGRHQPNKLLYTQVIVICVSTYYNFIVILYRNIDFPVIGEKSKLHET